nr:Peptidase S28 domain containing protein [Haemonchus contortus]
MSTVNLWTLSSAQAIEDTAAFIIGMKAKFPQLANVPWVTFGGSYAGALAVWARIRRPDVVAMAVGSSGPVQAQVDFKVSGGGRKRDYARVTSIAQSVTTAMNQVASLLQTASGRQSLKTTFNLCQDLNPADVNQIEYFWQNVYSPYMYVVQYSGDNAGLYANELTIKNAICRFHETQDNSLTKLLEVNNYVHQMMGSNGCMYVDYWNLVKYLQDTRYGQAQDSAHCADMYPSTPNDSPAMTEARKIIATTLQQWLPSAK